MNHFLKKSKHLVWLALMPWLLACKQEPPIYYPNANVSPAPNLGPAFVAGTYFDLEPHGYEQVEFFFRGEAKSYENVGPITPDGKWNVTPVDSEIYKTRMIIHRPTNPDDFNGTVLVEWMNVTGGVDLLSKHTHPRTQSTPCMSGTRHTHPITPSQRHTITPSHHHTIY